MVDVPHASGRIADAPTESVEAGAPGKEILADDIKLAWVLYRALQTSDRNALLQGDPGHLRYTIIDGRFNLVAVARRMRAAIKALPPN